MKNFIYLMAFAVFVLLSGCSEKPPTMADGQGKLHLVAVRNIGTEENPSYLPMPNAKVILSSEYGIMVQYTDSAGVLALNNLPASTYNVSVRMPHPNDPTILYVANQNSVQVNTIDIRSFTLYAKPVSSTGIAINEVYSVGPVNNFFFFYDQFVELYNASDSVKYLDGMMIMRVSGNNDGGKGPGADEGDDGDMDGVTYVFRFPGTPGGKAYPFEPHTFKVLAVDAVDHRKSVSTSIDLSNADWEMYNQFSADDIDNPNVPNLLNMKSETTVDFLISLSSDIICLSSGVDSVWNDGIDLSTIIDVVDYKTSATSKKTLDSRLDRGFVISPAKYSGKSIQRREPGVDTNDGSLDWEILPKPTPGKQ